MTSPRHRPFRTRDAAALGITRGALAGPRFRQVFRGVHVAADAPDTVALRADAAALLCPPESAFCGRTAAQLRGLPVDDDGAVHVALPRGVSPPDRRAGLCLHLAVPLDVVDRRGGRRLVPVPETWLGVAKECGVDEGGPVDLVILGDAILRRQTSSVDELAEHLERSRGRSGVPLARRALPLLRTRVDSPMETRTRLLLVFAGLPCPETNVPVFDDHGQRIGRPDLAYRRLRLAIQYEGDVHRTDRRRWQQDVGRDEVLQEHDWRVIKVVADDVFRRPVLLVRRVMAAAERQRAVLHLPAGFWL
ncbi:MAG TPA: hypothetical protein VK894_13340 [Jiangellales bacterium]|nr:hypothetical protein [Jiangellales bacterium]